YNPSYDVYGSGGSNGRVCTRSARGRLSLRTGPGRGYSKVKEIPNGHIVALRNGEYATDGFYWWYVSHNGSNGWVRADYVCGDPQ
ncbi:MAG: SH3 domain-containing protein, partial [Cyanobacteria bacterium P01_F01_bin.143]